LRKVWAAGMVMVGITLSAQQLDMPAVAKWSAARVVRYQITGTYQGTTPIAPRAAYGALEVTDRVTVELDWDIRANAVLGTARFTNAPSVVARTTPGKADCPPPTIEGTYEHFEVTAAVAHPAGLELKGTRSYPGADIPSQWPASCTTKRTAATREDVTEIVAIPSPMLLVTPAGANPNLTVAADRRSFTMKGQAWSWTYTPTLVK
jgi:hypothetical protein